MARANNSKAGSKKTSSTRPTTKKAAVRKVTSKAGPKKKSTSKKTQKKSSRSSGASASIRLNRFLAEAGICSRRKADELIDEGLVKVNGKTVYELGTKVNPEVDRVVYRGKKVEVAQTFSYFAFFKPRSVVTSTADPQGRPTVSDYFTKKKIRLYPVGRLDWDAEGLLLVTNDGDFAQQVIHPSQGIVKVYHAKISGLPTTQQLEKLRRGVSIVGGKVSAEFVKRLPKRTDKSCWIEIGITEGKNRQIKKMFAKIGYDVIKLRRVAIGGLKLSGLKAGQIRELKATELKKIFS